MSGYNSTPYAAYRTAIPAGREPMRDRLGRAWAYLSLMYRAAQTRRELGQLDPRLLADMGLGRAEAAREADRWPWDLGTSGTMGRTVGLRR